MDVMTTITSAACGVAAAGPGTLAMDASLYLRYRREGGEVAFAAWESSEGIARWEDAPAPALVAKRVLEALLGHELPPRHVRLLNNLTHWGFGLGAGAGYGILGARRAPAIWVGLPYGAGVWAFGYVVLPALGVYEPIWRYDVATLAKDLSAHLVFGTATAAAFRVICGKGDA
jgi:hypothetical protein